MIDPTLPEPQTPEVTPRVLRQFAGLCLLILGGLFVAGVVRHGGWPRTSGVVAGAIALLVGLPGLLRPDWIRPIFAAAMALTRPIGHVVGFAVLAIVFYGLITPLGLGFRWIGRDALALRKRSTVSYWVPRPPPTDVRRYLRQYQVSATTSRERPLETGASVPTSGAGPEHTSTESLIQRTRHDRSTR